MSLRQMLSRGSESNRREQEDSTERRWSRLGSKPKTGRDWAAFLLASAAIVGALAGLRASQLSSGATDDAARTKRIADGRATQLGWSARWVFTTIGPHKADEAILKARAASAREYARVTFDNDVKRSLLARAHALMVDRDRSFKVLIAYGDPYVNRTLDGTYSFGEHLAEYFDYATQMFPDPSPYRDAVARQSDRAVATMSLSIVAAIAFLLGAMAEVLTRFRRSLVVGGFALVLACAAALVVFDTWGVPWLQ